VQIWISPQDATVFVGSGAIVAPDIWAMNGVVHLVDDVLTTDASYNVTMIAAAEKLMGFGPFNDSQVGSTPPSLSPGDNIRNGVPFSKGRLVSESVACR
jgi:hypothetical protein